MSLEELNELYTRLHKSNNVNVIVDGVSFEALPYIKKAKIINMVVDVINYKKRIMRRDEIRKQNFKPDKAIKCLIKGKWFFGYPEFSKRGIVRTDNRARLIAKTTTGIMKVPLNCVVQLTPEEQREFKKEFIEKVGSYLLNKIKYWKGVNSQYYEKYKKEYEDLLKRFNK